MHRLRITHPARADIAVLLDHSADMFGVAARRRYEALLATALADIADDPLRAGSTERAQLGPGRRAYHLRHSRARARAVTGGVRAPRHLLVYRLVPPNLIVILRVLHDAMDLARYVRDDTEEA